MSTEMNFTLRLKADRSGFAGEAKAAARDVENLGKSADKASHEVDELSASLKGSANAAELNSKITGTNNAQLHQYSSANNTASQAVMKNAMSAKQLAAATRNLPAQFTDIFVGLASGQMPMMVLIQQGGQLKDMFGGIGPAFRAMGGYVLGLVNPFTVAAAAGAGLIAAFQMGSQEARAYQRELILTGNYAGTTSDEMGRMADRIAGVSGTERQASKVLQQLVTSGKFVVDQFDAIGLAATKMQAATGKAVEETVAEFESLAKSPTKSIAELNDRYHFLTASVYEQIAALEEQGKSSDAADLAIRTYSQTIQERSDDIAGNLGYVERAWNGIKNASKGALDALLEFGREESKLERLARLDSRRMRAQASRSGEGSEADALRAAIEAEEAAAKATREQRLRDEQSIAAQKEVAKIREQSLSKAAKMERELADYRENIEKIRAADPTSALLDEKRIAEDVANIRKRYQESGSDAAKRMLEQLRQQHSVLELQGDTAQRLTASQRAYAQFEQRIADIKTKDVLTAEEQSLLNSEAALRLQHQKNIALDDELKSRQELRKIQALDESLQSSLLLDKSRYDNQLQGMGMGERYRQQLQEQLAIQRDYQQQLDQLSKDFNNGLISESTFAAERSMLTDHLAARLEMYGEYYQQLQEKEQSWTVGASEALYNYLDEARNVAAQSEQLFANAFGRLEDSLFEFVTTGKLSFSDLAKNMASEVLRILIRQATSQVIMAGLNAYTSTAAIPVVGPVAAPGAAAGAMAAAGAIAAGINGMAHDGISRVPDEGTWLLNRNERVYTNESANQLDEMYGAVMMMRQGISAATPARQSSNGALTINVFNEGGERLSVREANTRQTRNGEELDLYLQASQRAIVDDLRNGGPISNAGAAYQGWRRT